MSKEIQPVRSMEKRLELLRLLLRKDILHLGNKMFPQFEKEDSGEKREAMAAEILDKINSGELDLDELAAKINASG